MIIDSDITGLGFTELPVEEFKLMKRFASNQRAALGLSKWQILLQSDRSRGKRRVVIKEFRSTNGSGWRMEHIFDGELESPADLLRIARELKIKSDEGNHSEGDPKADGVR